MFPKKAGIAMVAPEKYYYYYYFDFDHHSYHDGTVMEV